MPEPYTIIQENVSITGSLGTLEGILTYPDNMEPKQAILIVGPHPMLGGDFNNNIIAHLAERLTSPAAVTLRFNYRGVGQSAGKPIVSTDNISQFWATSKIDAEAGFAEDVEVVGTFLADAFGKVDSVIGYSFGACLASQWAMKQTALRYLTMIAPTIDQHDYTHLQSLDLPKLIISSKDDFAVPTEKLRDIYTQWQEPKQLVIEQTDNHFFRGYEEWLAEKIIAFQAGAE
ncbi:Hydrolase PA4440, alpha/beta fold family [hydrothermal vent metagenome]|uniref:Hydrolase PA4440, alpha/beta fold family n=1 Tax=hydrothermal vent metagenome TaxID=652676 RepID=A0A3B1DNR0_9ZZZZ